MLNLAKRMQAIQPFYVMAIFAKAKAMEATGASVIHMEIGEPDFPTPDPIIEAGQQALAAKKTHYTPAIGLAELREAIADFYQQRYQINVSPKQVVITPGASGALQLLLSSLIEAGEQVLLTDPGYPCHRHFVHLLNAEPIAMPVNAEQNYQPTVAQIEHYWQANTKAVLLASPSNPTGTLLSPELLNQLFNKIASLGGQLIVDEIYHGLVYQQQADTALSVSDQIFIINSFSKYFGMTGWRLGWIIAPEPYVPALDKLAQNIFLAPSTVAQYAALQAFTPETFAILEQRRQIFQQRRDYLLAELPKLGFNIKHSPEGAFYLYSNCEALSQDSLEFCQQLLQHVQVAITPGLDFGHYQAKQHLRFAYTTSMTNLAQGLDRIKQFLG